MSIGGIKLQIPGNSLLEVDGQVYVVKTSERA